MSNESNLERPCPFLGLLDDAETSDSFPSARNYCHRSRPIASPILKHQESVCLGGKHRECPVFLSQRAAPLPAELRAAYTGNRRNSLRKNLLIGFSALIVVLFLTWGVWFQGIMVFPGTNGQAQMVSPPASSTEDNAPFPTMTALMSPTLIPSSTPTFYIFSGPVEITTTLTHTPTMYRTATPSSTPSQLDVPIGTDYKFVIHKVQNSESFDSLASQYNTSADAIMAVNYGRGPIAWANTLLVIPVGFTDTSKLPSFVVYQVKPEQRGISVENMAKILRVNPLDLKYYNGWTSPSDRPLVGDLLLVPRLKIQPGSYELTPVVDGVKGM